MGRRKKYFTDIDIKNANIAKVKKFNDKNRERVNYSSKLRYWRNKILLVIESKVESDIIQVKLDAIKNGINQMDLIDLL